MINIEKGPTPEKRKGENVNITLKFIRHGERTPDGELKDYGREVTKEIAEEIEEGGYDAVKAYGSTAGPEGPEGMERSLETADILAEEIAGEDKYKTRPKDLLNYESLKTEPHYDHNKVYKEALPDNFQELSDDEKAKASRKAQEVTVKRLMSEDSDHAKKFRKEIAGAFSSYVDRYIDMTDKLDSGSNVLFPSGTHGGLMEPFLEKTLIREKENGDTVRGFDSIEEFGGPITPSEGFNVEIKTNDEGEVEKVKVEFDDGSRFADEDLYLDLDKISELSEFYEDMHED